jgi:hypothetical protein
MDERTSKSAVRANHPESTEKTPIYIPVIHTRADMGALSEAIQRWKVKKLVEKAGSAIQQRRERARHECHASRFRSQEGNSH